MPLVQGITADLTIQGDPRLVWPETIQGSYISVIFVNPFLSNKILSVPIKLKEIG